MIQAGIHVGAGVVLGVAAGWWLGDWEQSLQVKDSVARVDCLLYGALLVVLLRHDGWLRRLGLLGLGQFCGSLLVYSVKGSVPYPSVTLGQIFTGSTPYFILILVAAMVVLLIPGLSTWLPALML